MRIPTPDDIARQDSNANHAKEVQRLTEALSDALSRRNYTPSVLGHFSDQVISEVAAEFRQSGWNLTKTGQARSETYFELRAA
ncbi:MAG: hypothetical protein HY711_03855 [Candidatus Melainabacteria bacterium]|nr:hypothetical protein [Candidatus Melainabacteria bacterium]